MVTTAASQRVFSQPGPSGCDLQTLPQQMRTSCKNFANSIKEGAQCSGCLKVLRLEAAAADMQLKFLPSLGQDWRAESTNLLCACATSTAQAHLKVTAADKEVDLALLPPLQALESGVDGIQLAMAAPLHSNLQDRAQLELGSRKCCKRGALAAAFYSKCKVQAALRHEHDRRCQAWQTALLGAAQGTVLCWVRGLEQGVLSPGDLVLPCCLQAWQALVLSASD